MKKITVECKNCGTDVILTSPGEDQLHSGRCKGCGKVNVALAVETIVLDRVLIVQGKKGLYRIDPDKGIR